MSAEYRDRPGRGGVCKDCAHDLFARSDGRVYCSNRRCRHHDKAYPLTSKVNDGGDKE